jgi:beta-lactamase class D
MNKITYAVLSFFLFTLGSCTVNNTKIDNSLKKYFDSSRVAGCFSFFDNQKGNVTVYNMKLDTERLPAGTSFKILNSLIGIQTGKISNENTVLNSDSSQNKKLTFKEAFHDSSPQFFQALAREIGKNTMKYWIDSLHYGNQDISGPVDSLGLNPYLKISPDEQLGLVSKIYFEQLPLQKYAQQMVQDQMLQEDNTLYELSYATGTGTDEKGNSFGWISGWIVENRHVYFFVTYITSPGKKMDMQAIAIHISKSILKAKGFFKGEK